MGTRSSLCVLASAVALMAPAGPAVASDGERGFSLGGRECELIEVPAAAPFGGGPCPGVRPGALVETDAGLCTLNFVFAGSDGRRYIGTAGHCVLGEGVVGGADAGEKTWAPGSGPEALDASGDRIGEFAYAILEDPRDFALIRLDQGVVADPQMCHFGGPAAIDARRPSVPVGLHHFGNGIVIGDVLGARSAIALGMPDPDHVFAQGVAAPGDSGSGVISADGGAVGVLVTVGVHVASVGTSGLDAGVVGITRLGPQLRGAERALATTLRLETAPPL